MHQLSETSFPSTSISPFLSLFCVSCYSALLDCRKWDSPFWTVLQEHPEMLRATGNTCTLQFFLLIHGPCVFTFPPREALQWLLFGASELSLHWSQTFKLLLSKAKAIWACCVSDILSGSFPKLPTDPWAGWMPTEYTGQGGKSCPKWNSILWCDTSSCHFEWQATENLWIIHFWNFLSDVSGPRLMVGDGKHRKENCTESGRCPPFCAALPVLPDIFTCTEACCS